MVSAVLKRSQVEEISFSQLLWRLTEELAWQALSLPVAVSSQVQVCSWTSDAVVVSFLDWPCGCGRGVTKGAKGAQFPWRRVNTGRQIIAGSPKSPTNVTSTFFIAMILLSKELRFEHGGVKLASCPGRHLTSLRPWAVVQDCSINSRSIHHPIKYSQRPSFSYSAAGIGRAGLFKSVHPSCLVITHSGFLLSWISACLCIDERRVACVFDDLFGQHRVVLSSKTTA